MLAFPTTITSGPYLDLPQVLQLSVGNMSLHVPNRPPKYSEHSDWADTFALALPSPAGDLHSEVHSRQHSDQVWPLKTSGSRWVPSR